MVVYFHRNPKTYEIFYVGIGSLSRRAYQFTGKSRNQYWHRYVSKYGNPVVQIVHSGISKAFAIKWEMFYIKLLGRVNLCNLTDGGEIPTNLFEWHKNNPGRNFMQTPEGRLRLINNNPMHNPIAVEKIRIANTGKKTSYETRIKQSILKKGKPSNQPKGFKHSVETIEKLKFINKEIVNRPEVKAKLRLSMLGKRNVSKHVKVTMIDLKTNIPINTFDCITDALKHLGRDLKSGNITSACVGRRNNAYGYKWEYAA